MKDKKDSPKKDGASKKKNLKTPVTMAQKYECAWNKIFNEQSKWKQKIINEEPEGRHAKEVYRAVTNLAESPNFKPKLARYLGKVEKEVKPQPLNVSGFFGNN